MLETNGLGIEHGLSIKKINKGKVLGITGSVVSAIAVALGIHFMTAEEAQGGLDMSLADPDLKLEEPFRSLTGMPSLLMGGTELLTLTRSERAAFILNQLETKRATVVTAAYENYSQEITLGELGLALTEDLDAILDRIEEVETNLFNQDFLQQRIPSVLDLGFTVSEESIYAWTSQLAGHLNVAPVEPGLRMPSRGNFQVVSGQDGSRIDTQQFVVDAIAAINAGETDRPIELTSYAVSPRFDESLLAGIDTMVASFSSDFNRGDVSRATNIDLGSDFINGHVIMPGEIFNYNSLFPMELSPTQGFAIGTAFINGRITNTIGGGLCQVTSTLYGAMLRMGILPILSAPHKHRVHYVPGGLDACMWNEPGNPCNLIFSNPYDVPIFVTSYTTPGGTINVEFWATADVLGGYTFEPVSQMIGGTLGGWETWDSWLRTYRDGELVNEQFLRRDTYSPVGN